MTQHLDDIHRYIRLVETNPQPEDDSFLLESVSEIMDIDRVNTLMEDLGDVMFKIKSYREPGGNEDYATGVEEGLQLAADMLTRLIENHSGK
jgi:hypothetical protein